MPAFREEARPDDAGALLDANKSRGAEIRRVDAELATLDAERGGLLDKLPNLPHESVPTGKGAEENVEVPWDKFCFKVATLYFNLSTTYASWDRAIALIASGKLPVEKLITHKEPLEKWDEVFTACENLEALKGLLIPA